MLPIARTASLDASLGTVGATPGILVVDDERAVRGVVVRLLRRRGYDAIEAPDAETALMLLGTEAGRIRLVITDDRMPGMSGQELIAVIARIYPEIHLLLMSGIAGEAGLASERGGHMWVLLKPFTSENLLAAVTELMA